MWFERKRSNDVTEEQPQHWPTERMINEGHPDVATAGDLVELDVDALYAVAEICKVTEMAPDECIPCLAFATGLERQSAEQNASIEETLAEIDAEEGEFLPRLAVSLAAVPPWTESDIAPDDTPVADQFASKVAELSLLVEELLEGPPIPPPNVTISDLALLTLAADRWVKITDAQGVSFGAEQQQMLDATRDLVARLRA